VQKNILSRRSHSETQASTGSASTTTQNSNQDLAIGQNTVITCSAPRKYVYTLDKDSSLQCDKVPEIFSASIPDEGLALAVFEGNVVNSQKAGQKYALHSWTGSASVGSSSFSGQIGFGSGEAVCAQQKGTVRLLAYGQLTKDANRASVKLGQYVSSGCKSGALRVLSGAKFTVWVEDPRPECANKNIIAKSYFREVWNKGGSGAQLVTYPGTNLTPVLSTSVDLQKGHQTKVFGQVQISVDSTRNVCGGQYETAGAMLIASGAVNSNIRYENVLPVSAGITHGLYFPSLSFTSETNDSLKIDLSAYVNQTKNSNGRAKVGETYSGDTVIAVVKENALSAVGGNPSPTPSFVPSFSPSVSPTATPSSSPIAIPSISPSPNPSSSSSTIPSSSPSSVPSSSPGNTPSPSPSLPSNLEGKMGLIDIHQSTSLLISSIQSNTDFYNAYSKTISVKKGQVLRIHGQAEATNENALNIQICSRLVVDGVVVSPTPCENANVSTNHHQPGWVDASVTITSDHQATVSLQVSAAREGSSPSINLESGYGQILIEQYDNRKTLNPSDQYGVIGFAKSVVASNSGYGSPAYTFTNINYFNANAKKGDLFVLRGQTTSQADQYDMHGSHIAVGNPNSTYSQISPWSTADHVWDTYYLPISTTAYYYVSALNGNLQFFTRMHSSLGRYNTVKTDASGLLSLQFRRGNEDENQEAKYLASSTTVSTALAGSVITNLGEVTFTKHTINLLKGDIVRVRGLSEPVFPGSRDHVFCASHIHTYLGSELISTSQYTYKYVNYNSASTPLNNDDVFQAPADGAYQIQLDALCSTYLGNFAVQIAMPEMIIDRFSR